MWKKVKKGLKLAIFNSCDGLGLARKLVDLRIPYAIVMREPVPDIVAQKFLQYFLTAFAGGESFYSSVRLARKRLQEELEDKYPCASWLPVIFQNPVAAELKYPKQRNWHFYGLFGAIAIISIWIGLDKLRQEIEIKSRISLGEKILVEKVSNADKKAGGKEFRKGNFDQAVRFFEKSLQKNHNDPETLIYLNNSRIGNGSALKIAVSVPIGSNLDVAQEILRGVAQAQDEQNSKGGINGRRLEVEIANDENSPDIAKQLASKFVESPEIMAVVGHNVSDASVVAAPVYEQGKLVMVSPTSFSAKLTEFKYIYRAVPSIESVADSLFEYVIKTAHKKKIAICVDEKAQDNKSFRNRVQSDLQNKYNNEFVNIKCDFSAPDFNPRNVIYNARNNGADGLLLAPHIDKIDKALDLAKANNRQFTLFASPTLYTSQTLKSGQADVDGMVVAVPWHPSAIPGNPFTKNAQKLWNAPVTWRTAMAYDATMAIATGLEQSNSREQLQQALSSPSFSANGAMGKFGFLPSGDRNLNGKAILVKIQPSSQSPTGYDFVPLNP